MSQVHIQGGRPATLRRATAVTRLLLSICGAVAIVLGLLFWAGTARALLPLHMLAGLGLTFALGLLALLAWIAGVRRDLIALALGWCVMLPLLGITQTRLLPGAAHWLIEVVHLLVGIGAMVLGQRLVARIMNVLNE